MILDELAAYAEERVKEAKLHIPFDELKAAALDAPQKTHKFKNALQRDGISFIAEIKKASPSKGIIDPEFQYLEIARSYERIGADCISCLTEPKWFLGSDEIFKNVRRTVSTPMLRKDFTVDEYQIYEARLLGADAVLLICSLLPTEVISEYLGICSTLGLDALVETHSSEEIESALNAGAEIIGVNNRNLKDFSMNIENAAELRGLVPRNKLFVAESGIKTPEDIAALRRAGVDAVLIGETLMRAKDKKKVFDSLKGEAL